MGIVDKKQAVHLGIRIGTVFLAAVVIIITAAYYVLSGNVHNLLTRYTLGILESMTEQGVTIVENELENGKNEISFLADLFPVPEGIDSRAAFSRTHMKEGDFRILYVTEAGTASSDGRQRDVRERPDIQAAWSGEAAVYGPYYNEENEYVVCYSAPVRRGDKTLGVLSIEKDGYRFCDLITNIQFAGSGEAYIINADGTDIAVSDQNHIDWVTTQYNAQRIYAEQADEETRSILELERNGLDGKTGTGTYYWNGGLCYLFYTPIESAGWVLLSGIREEEIAAMTKTTLFDSVLKGPALQLCFALVLILTAMITYWIITEMKRNAKINEELERIANYDSLTGLLNRNSYNAALDSLAKEDQGSLACVYMDANGLHDINNHLGHLAGDRMLQTIAEALRKEFPRDEIYRIGGDEFVVLCRRRSEQEVRRMAESVRRAAGRESYDVSIGIAWQKSNRNMESLVNDAEEAMQRDKEEYYLNNGKERRMRTVNKQLEQIMLEKEDADAFLSVLAPDYKGVYFVNLNDDTFRHLYIPPYFAEILRETGNCFSRALLLYAARIVKPEYYQLFEDVCEYARLDQRLNNNSLPEFVFQKTDGEWLKVRIMKFKDYTKGQKETLWMFTIVERPENEAEALDCLRDRMVYNSR